MAVKMGCFTSEQEPITGIWAVLIPKSCLLVKRTTSASFRLQLTELAAFAAIKGPDSCSSVVTELIPTYLGFVGSLLTVATAMATAVTMA